MPASAHEWIASASIEELRASANATNFVIAMPVLASRAATTARVPPSPAMRGRLPSGDGVLGHGLLDGLLDGDRRSRRPRAGASASRTASSTCFSALAERVDGVVEHLRDRRPGEQQRQSQPAASVVTTGSESAAWSSAQPM